MIIKFSDKDLDGGSYLPEGEHEVSIVRALAETSKAGNDMIVVEIADKFGRQLKEYFLTDAKSLWKLARFAVSCGFDKESLKNVGLDTASLVGRKMIAVKKQTGVKIFDGKEKKEFHTEFFPCAQDKAKEEEVLPF